MDGLLPYLLHAFKHNKDHHKILRSQSMGSTTTRSYHQLVGESVSNSVEGSSHLRTRSEFQPPVFDFMEQRSGFDLHSRSLKFVDSHGLPAKQIGTSNLRNAHK